MDARKALRWSILGFWALIVLYTAALAIEERYMPEPLRAYTTEREANITVFEWIAIIIALLLIVASAAASMGIFKSRPWARPLFLWSMLIEGPTLLLVGPTITMPVAAMLEVFIGMIAGVAIGLLYFSPAKIDFERKTAPAENRGKMAAT